MQIAAAVMDPLLRKKTKNWYNFALQMPGNGHLYVT